MRVAFCNLCGAKITKENATHRCYADGTVNARGLFVTWNDGDYCDRCLLVELRKILSGSDKT